MLGLGLVVVEVGVKLWCLLRRALLPWRLAASLLWTVIAGHVFLILVIVVGLHSVSHSCDLSGVDLLGPLNGAILGGTDKLPHDLSRSSKTNSQLFFSNITLFDLGQRVRCLRGRDVREGVEGELLACWELSGVTEEIPPFHHEESFVGHEEGALLFGKH